MHIADEKEQLRDAIKQRLARLSDKERAAESRSICRRILETLPQNATIAAYIALKTEPDLSMVIEQLHNNGSTVYLPRFEDQKLAFRRFAGFDRLTPGDLKIPEPPADAEALDPTDLDVVLVPGRAFDKQGWRIGRGNGGYDIWIEHQRNLHPSTRYWGVAFDCQIVPEVPTEGHDQKMDAVVAGRGFCE